MRRSPGPRSPAGARTIISPPTRRFASAAGRSSAQRNAAGRVQGARAPRCAIPAAPPERLDISDGARAEAFFEEHFLPLRISRLGEGDGFVTGYYEPVIDGSRTQTDVYNVPVYRRPSNLFVRGVKQSAVGLPNKGQVFRKIGRRKLVPYYDRGRDRGRRDRRPRAGNLLAEEPDRSAVHPDPGLGAGPARGRLDGAHQLRRP